MMPPRLTSAAAVVAACAVLFFFVRLSQYAARPTGGFIAYSAAGKMLARGEPMSGLYDSAAFRASSARLTGVPSGDVYAINTPALPFLFAPLAPLTVQEGKFAWEIFSLAALIAAGWILLTAFPFTTAERLALAGLFFASTPLYLDFVKGQMYAFLLLLHALLYLAWKRGNDLRGGAVVGLLLALKGYGLFFLAAAIFMRRWKMAAAAAAAYALIFAAAASIIGFAPWEGYAGALAKALGAMPPAAAYQQNLGSFLARLFARDAANPSPLVDLPAVVTPLIGIAAAGGLLLLYRLARKEGPDRPSGTLVAAATILGVVTAPMLYDYHYALLLLPVLIGYRTLRAGGSIAEIILFTAGIFLVTVRLPYESPFFQQLPAFVAFPRVAGGAALLWLIGWGPRGRENAPSR